MKKKIIQCALGSLVCVSSIFAGTFSGDASHFNSPIKLAYDFSALLDMEALVIVQNEVGALSEIAAVELPHTAELQGAYR